ncbi:MAG: hypothetical protein V7L25_18035 [Nostoc sp.]|uniref:hypothetical protein n=1 Tax=Nostoc sp. TaxID=1180 RepID=UPI002FEE9DB8
MTSTDKAIFTFDQQLYTELTPEEAEPISGDALPPTFINRAFDADGNLIAVNTGNRAAGVKVKWAFGFDSDCKIILPQAEAKFDKPDPFIPFTKVRFDGWEAC